MRNRWVICFIINAARTHALLIHKKGGPYPDKLNGIGGHIEPGETPREAIVREVFEEADLVFHPEDFRYAHKNEFVNGDELYIYYLITNTFDPDFVYVSEEGVVSWHGIDSENLLDVQNTSLAGTGNVPYIINMALVESRKKTPPLPACMFCGSVPCICEDREKRDETPATFPTCPECHRPLAVSGCRPGACKSTHMLREGVG